MGKHATGRPSSVRRFLSVGLFLVVALAVTYGFRNWRTAQVADTAERRQQHVVHEALADVEADFIAMQQTVLARSTALAEAAPVVEGLRAWRSGNREQALERLTRYVAALDIPERWAVELYGDSLYTLAWKGFSMPLDAAPEAARFLDGFQVAIAEDADWRVALAVWVPVRDGGRVLGAVRMLRMLRARAPVRNQFLRDYDISIAWQRQANLPLQATFTPPFTEANAAHRQTRLLQGLDGTLLGRVAIERPTPDDLVEQTRRRYDDVLAFWATLLVGWVLAGLWAWYRAAYERRADGGAVRIGVGARLALGAVGWWMGRYALLLLDVPARWQQGRTLLAPLFDPTHLASTFGSGLMRSTGDFLISTVFLLLFAFAFLGYAARFRQRASSLEIKSLSWPRLLGGLLLTVLFIFGMTVLLALVAQHAILDSTLDFFTREGLFPKPLVLIIFCTLLLATLAVVAFGISVTWLAMEPARLWSVAGHSRWVVLGGLLLAIGGPYVVLYGVFGMERWVSWPIALAFLAVSVGGASVVRRGSTGLGWLTLRSVLPVLFILSILLYPLVFRGLDVQRRQRMVDAATSFDEGRDPGVMFAMSRLLTEARAEPSVGPALEQVSTDERFRDHLDSLATMLLHGSLLASQSAYDVSLVFIDDEGQPVGRYDATEQTLSRAALDQSDAEQFDILPAMYAERATTGPMVEQVTGRRESDRFQYVGVVPVGDAGWIMARAEPRSLLQESGTPFLRVLLPAGYGNIYANLSVAEFRNGVLVRSFGRDFGRYRLDESVRRTLNTQSTLWKVEKVEERRFLTYYDRDARASEAPILTLEAQMVDAVRVPVISIFDHLFFLLRLTVAGLIVGLPFYVLGLFLRRCAGQLPAPRQRFRDKVLNAFLSVGILAILAVGFIGINVVTEENERAVQSWLRQHLERVEETLALEAQGAEMPYRVLDRIRIDSLAVLVGLDLNLYEGGRLIRSSRPQLLRERLIDQRLPITAYRDLYLDGYQFTYVQEQIGSFSYTAGYRALLDEQGKPAYVVSVPTLPEQERIEEERARTVAYLFGALLVLVVAVLGTAALLANALARPIARLRVGLQDVALGRFERKLPVDTRDEIGELVETFNAMQEQLAESRRQLAQQERQLAWREMARQVAHEIKNPLTPMKLSVQHLRRAYQDVMRESNGAAEAEGIHTGRFAQMFDRVTGTLVEQIDTLARIANEFSTFARLPTRIPERLDLNDILREAVRLMQAEADIEIEQELAPEPLIVEADHEELRRTYINLLKNALQALPDAEGFVRVTTRREEDGTAYSTISDTGTGVPEDVRDKIFEPNFSTKTSGTGLGLAIARKTVEEHNGSIGFETEEGQGTTFWIRLPLID